jgi:hypothetical protein
MRRKTRYYGQRYTEFNFLQDQAELILCLFTKRFDFPDGLPVPVEIIAEGVFGLRCETGRFERWDKHTVGALSVDDRVICVDDRFNWHQRVFAVAHEIGHWVLHEGNQCLQLSSGIKLNHFLESTSAKTEEQKNDLRDTEANRFAAALLMPRPLLFSQAKNYTVIDARAIRELADTFCVSMEAMLIRVRDLSKHLKWRGPRIDEDSLDQLQTGLARRWRTGEQTTRPAPSTSRPRFVVDPAAATTMEGLLARLIGGYARKQLIAQKHEARPAKPVVIEFAGSPNSGKDKLINMVILYLENVCKHKVRYFEEGIKFCNIDKELEFARLHYTVARVVKELYEAKYENPGNYEFAIFNRGLFDRLSWLHAAAQEPGGISREQELIQANYVLSHAHLQDMVFLFLASSEDSLLREEKEDGSGILMRLVAERDGQGEIDRKIHGKAVLTSLNSSYLHMYDAYQEEFHPIYLFDFARHKDADTLEESLLGKINGLADAILPREGTQLPFQQMFGIRYVNGNSSGKHRPVRPRPPRPSAQQLTLLESEPDRCAPGAAVGSPPSA